MKKIKTKNFIKFIYLLSVFFACLTVFYLAVFLYKNVYTTLKDVEIIYGLQGEVAIENINTKLFEEIENNINKKINSPLPDFNLIENPFE